MNLEHITSRQNAFVKKLKQLAENKRARHEAGLVFLEGEHLLHTLLDTGGRPEAIIIAARALSNPSVQSLLMTSPDARHVVLADTLFDQLATTDTPAGILALAPMPIPSGAPQMAVDTLVLESVQDPGNVGSLIRTAVAAGVKQVVLSAGCADVWAPRCLRAAQGAHWLAKIYPDTSPRDFVAGFQGNIAATILLGGKSLYEQDLRPPTAWLFGHEGQGLSTALVDRANCRVTIPMPGGMESLNVNAAAAVCLFEQGRQRAQSLR